MSKASLKKCLARKYPDLRKRGDFFYFKEAQLLIRGFALDVPPSRTSVLMFLMPIFDKIDDLHLGLSSEVARFGSLAANEPDFLCEKIKLSLEGQLVMEEDFDDLGALKKYLGNVDEGGIYSRWCRALIDCWEGRFESAKGKVDCLMSETNDGLIFPSSGLRDLHYVLHNYPERAPAQLAQWRTENLVAFLS